MGGDALESNTARGPPPQALVAMECDTLRGDLDVRRSLLKSVEPDDHSPLAISLAPSPYRSRGWR